MTTNATIVNRALQMIGTRTTVSDAELTANSTNEAIQANLVLENIRDDLLRMAPWNCAIKTANLVYITSAPVTPENTSAPTTLWQPGQPPPPWSYEYQYPVDCLRACYIIPATKTGFAGGVPITSAVTGGAASFWQGPPVRFKVQTDQFYPVVGATLAAAGNGYVPGEVITLPVGPNTNPPIGAPAQIQVLTTTGAGAISTFQVVNQISGADTDGDPIGGSYFQPQPNPQLQASSTGSGAGASFNLTFGPSQISQRVIVTNQEFATLGYCQQVTDPNVMDTQFQSAWSTVLGATLAMALSGNIKLANDLIGQANRTIETARVSDGNEGLTVNDVTPDWIRIRGIWYTEQYSGPFSGFDWGSMWPTLG